ncbi:hypothetical protein [Acinetobacter baumannii]|uniref:hypothetical protein n=2 Tax=Acinetobacter baumannii TaxID=470 RepID=UPI0013602654|nr:hypothetical protein [Acinetobacter baumannii]CAA0191482.1 hypothetical protein AB945B12_01110 [Acinetobacter baumannii]
MRHVVSEVQTKEEIQSSFKPAVLDSSFSILPFNQLGDREFEILVYSLVNEEIKKNLHPHITKIALMQGVGERGRDCTLYNSEGICGLIQCKKYNNRLSKPQILKELIKFALYAIQDNSILPDTNNFKYIFYVSNDYSGSCVDLIFNYKNLILKEIINNEISKFIDQIVEEFESFRTLRQSIPYDKVYEILKNIDVSGVNGVELTNRIQSQPNILHSFFNIKVVVSLEDADKIFRNLLDDYGLRFLTDEDLIFIKERIDHTPTEHRLGFGFVDFYGFSTDFFNNLNNDEFGEILKAAVDFQMLLNSKLVNLMHKKIHSLIFEKVTQPLLFTKKIHQFSIGLCAPYLIKRVVVSMLNGGMPESFKFSLTKEMQKSEDEVIQEIIIYLLSTSERIMKGDYSELKGDEELILKKKELYEHLHEGMQSVEDLKNQIYSDIDILKPILKEIEDKLKELFSEKRTIVISDSSFLGNKERLIKVFNNTKKIGNSN